MTDIAGKKEYLLGIDNGGTVCKAAVFDKCGRQVASGSVRIPLSVNSGGKTERDPAEIIGKNLELIRNVISGIDGKIAAVGLSGHGKGLYLLDKKGTPLGGGIASTDSRAGGYELSFRSDGTEAEARKITFQNTLACQPVCLLRWLKDNDRNTYDRIGMILSVKDLVGYALTGEAVTDRTDMSGSGFMNLETGNYDPSLTALFGIGEMNACLPEIRSPFDIRGYVTPETARVTGLDAGTPVSCGMFDIDACALSAGTVDPGDICMIAGTWSINEYISPAPVLHGVAMNSLYCVDGLYLAEESSAASAGNLEWVRGILRKHSYRELDSLVSGTDPADSGVYFLPFLYASNLTPYAKACFIGLDSGHTDADMIRAVYEGVVYSGYTHLERLLDSIGTHTGRIILAGGVVNSDVWTQMFADTVGRDIFAACDAEPGAKGAAMSAGIACGMFGNVHDAAEKCTRGGKTVAPDPEMTGIYRKKYGVYRKIESALSTVWDDIRAIGGKNA